MFVVVAVAALEIPSTTPETATMNLAIAPVVLSVFAASDDYEPVALPCVVVVVPPVAAAVVVVVAIALRPMVLAGPKRLDRPQSRPH